MSLFAIADLHLSFGVDKPMDIFSGWKDYTERLKENWEKMVDDNDTVVIAGDISWAMDIADAKPDFEFINKLPGKKIMLKGNHDYWFQTKNKVDIFLKENGFASIQMLFNNAYLYEDYAICGTRGWMNEKGQNPDKKIMLREAGRLQLSLDAGKKLADKQIVFLHYPPVYENDVCKEIVDVLHQNSIKKCYYGHLHGASCKNAFVGERSGIEYDLISCDYTQFKPIKVL